MQKLGMPASSREIYFEQQDEDSNNCQVHALNNTYGDCILTPESLRGFIQVKKREEEGNTCWDYVYYPRIGFSDDAIAEWLRSNDLALQPIAHMPAHTHNIQSLLSRHSDSHSCNAFLCRAHHHSFAVRKIRNEWILLDSLLRKPEKINSSTERMSRSFTIFKLCDNTARDPPALPDLYMEKQEKAFCLVHAFNMALGSQIIQGNDVLSHIQQMEDTLIQRELDSFVCLKRYYTPGIGSFNNMILNHYLHYHPWNADKQLTVRPVRTDLRTGQITLELIEGLLLTAYCKHSAILTSIHSNNQGHAVALKEDIESDTWFLLDSLQDQPRPLIAENDWESLHASIMAIQ